jgi:hypothetical protein
VRLWTGFQWTIHVHVVCLCSSPRPTRPSEVRRVRARVYFSLSPLRHNLTNAYRVTHYLSRLPSTFTSNIGLKSCHSSCIWMGIWDLLEIISNFTWVRPNNSNKLCFSWWRWGSSWGWRLLQVLVAQTNLEECNGVDYPGRPRLRLSSSGSGMVWRRWLAQAEGWER